MYLFFVGWYNYTMSKKIVKVVLNSVSQDARVIKQAQSLSQAGFEINP